MTTTTTDRSFSQHQSRRRSPWSNIITSRAALRVCGGPFDPQQAPDGTATCFRCGHQRPRTRLRGSADDARPAQRPVARSCRRRSSEPFAKETGLMATLRDVAARNVGAPACRPSVKHCPACQKLTPRAAATESGGRGQGQASLGRAPKSPNEYGPVFACKMSGVPLWG